MQRIREADRAHQELNAKISEECEGKGYVDLTPQFEFGDVDYIKIHPRIPVKIAEGWHSTMVFKDGDIDKYSVTFDEGSVLEWHSHLQKERILVKRGKLKLYYVGKTYPQDPQDMEDHIVEVLLEVGDHFHLSSQILHKVEALERGFCMVSFVPPLSADDNPLPDVGDD